MISPKSYCACAFFLVWSARILFCGQSKQFCSIPRFNQFCSTLQTLTMWLNSHMTMYGLSHFLLLAAIYGFTPKITGNEPNSICGIHVLLAFVGICCLFMNFAWLAAVTLNVPGAGIAGEKTLLLIITKCSLMGMESKEIHWCLFRIFDLRILIVWRNVRERKVLLQKAAVVSHWNHTSFKRINTCLIFS